MNRKKAGWLYLIIACISIGISSLLSILYVKTGFELSMIPNILISEAMLIVPAFFILLISKEKWTEILCIRKIKWSTFFGVIAFTLAASPLVTLVNLISQLFVENTVNANSSQFLSLHPALLIFFVGILAPICEEIVFRGVIFSGYKKEGNIFKAILTSGFLFGIMHMNLNQASYALVIGILLGFLVQATGSIFSSILFHVLVNSSNAVLMLLTDGLFSDELLETTQQSIDIATMLNMICIYTVFALIGMVLVVCLLVWMSKNEGREEALKMAWDDRKGKKGTILSFPYVFGVVVSIAFMVIQMVI